MGIVTADISVTLDGYGAGPNQRLEAPFGDFDDDRVHAWQFEYAAENKAEVAGIAEADAYVMGRNMFAPGAVSGTWTGRAGGARSRRTTHRSSCSPTTRASHCR